MQATYYGPSDQNLAGPSATLAPGGQPDLLIVLSALRAAPLGAVITLATSKWVAPADGTHWALAMVPPAADGSVALYFERSVVTGILGPFTVTVTYPDNTTETVVAVAAPVPVPPPPPQPDPVPTPIPTPDAAILARLAAVEMALAAQVTVNAMTLERIDALDNSVRSIDTVVNAQAMLLADLDLSASTLKALLLALDAWLATVKGTP